MKSLGIALDVQGLLYILNTYASQDAAIIMVSSEDIQPGVEVLYDENTNIVILK